MTLSETLTMHNRPPSDPREPPVADLDVSRAERQSALAQTLIERAAIVESCGDAVLKTMTGPSYHDLKEAERKQRDRIAETIAEVRFGLPLDQIPRADRLECEYAAVYCLRRCHRSWRELAALHAAHAIETMLGYELGQPFASLGAERMRRVSQQLRGAAFAGFVAVLEDVGVISPGDYLRCHAGTLESEAR